VERHFFLDHQGWLVGECGESGHRRTTVLVEHEQPVKSVSWRRIRTKSNGVAVGSGGAVLATHDGATVAGAEGTNLEHLFDFTWDVRNGWPRRQPAFVDGRCTTTDWNPAQAQAGSRMAHQDQT